MSMQVLYGANNIPKLEGFFLQAGVGVRGTLVPRCLLHEFSRAHLAAKLGFTLTPPAPLFISL